MFNITPRFFQETCEKMFGANNCTFSMWDNKSWVCTTLMCRIQCVAFGRTVACLTVFTDNASILNVYPYNSELADKTTRFSFRVKRLLKWATDPEINRQKLLDGLIKQFNNQFYRHTDDIEYIIDKITEDVFAVDLRKLGNKLVDRADILQFGHPRREESCTNAKDKEGCYDQERKKEIIHWECHRG